jgi:hypothetical protein
VITRHAGMRHWPGAMLLATMLLTSPALVSFAWAAVDCVTETGNHGAALEAKIYSCGYPSDPSYRIRLDITGPQSWSKVYDGEYPATSWSGSVTATKAGTYTFTFVENSNGAIYRTTSTVTLSVADVGSATEPPPAPTVVPQVTAKPTPKPTPKATSVPAVTARPTVLPVATSTPNPRPSTTQAVPSAPAPAATPVPTPSTFPTPSRAPAATPEPAGTESSPDAAAQSAQPAIATTLVGGPPRELPFAVGLALLVPVGLGLILLAARKRRRARA